MLLESMEIQKSFQQAGISYAVLKGLSLWPGAVPKPELRSQFDLDFLVSERDVAPARDKLERSGYRLYAVSGRSSEFKKNERPGVSLKDIYKHFNSYGVELHAEAGNANGASVLERVQWRDVNGFAMPVLNPVDLSLVTGFTRSSTCAENMLARRSSLSFADMRSGIEMTLISGARFEQWLKEIGEHALG